jgi:divalent metal cation (Fe/Co/Zn/Cd) transporter
VVITGKGIFFTSQPLCIKFTLLMDGIGVKSLDQRHLYKIAFALAIFTISYNFIEGLISIYFGYEDESLTLFGFGVDSFIEVISGLGIATMILRIQANVDKTSDFERTALRVTGFAFYFLVAGLILTSAYNVSTGHRPATTFWGVVISLVSIAIMWALIYGKVKVGRQLNSQAILADAECTKVCIYMSVILLISSAVYHLTEFLYIDVVGSLGLAYFSFREGKECFEKARGKECCTH